MASSGWLGGYSSGQAFFDIQPTIKLDRWTASKIAKITTIHRMLLMPSAVNISIPFFSFDSANRFVTWVRCEMSLETA
jgi:predicted permease